LLPQLEAVLARARTGVGPERITALEADIGTPTMELALELLDAEIPSTALPSAYWPQPAGFRRHPGEQRVVITTTTRDERSSQQISALPRQACSTRKRQSRCKRE
jgi:hypothetical protein